MARLRYAGLSGSIGSSGLTNSATSHTFTAPLTYANGATVPTLSSPDYFMLTLFDSVGNLTEVVKVTAYNSSTGAATIVRGQEGTSGVARSSGDKVSMGAYPTDFGIVPTVVGSTSGYNDSGNTVSLTVPAGTLAGDLLVVMAGGNWSFSSVSGGNPANSWNNVTNSGSQQMGSLSMATASGTSASSTITVTYGNGPLDAHLVVLRNWAFICMASAIQTGSGGTSYTTPISVKPTGLLVVYHISIRVASQTISGNYGTRIQDRHADAQLSSATFAAVEPGGDLGAICTWSSSAAGMAMNVLAVGG